MAPARIRRDILTLGACGILLAGFGGFVGRIIWLDEQNDQGAARRMANDKISDIFSEESPEGWQFAYLQRNHNLILEPASLSDFTVRVNNHEFLRLSKTRADWITDIKIYLKHNGYYGPYRKAVALGIQHPNRPYKEVFLREQPNKEIDNQVLHFLNHRKNLEAYVSIEPVYLYGNTSTITYFDVTPMKLIKT